jgi:hypothetical protein
MLVNARGRQTSKLAMMALSSRHTFLEVLSSQTWTAGASRAVLFWAVVLGPSDPLRPKIVRRQNG